MQARFVSRILGLSAGLLLCLVPTSEAAESRKVETRGKEFFKRNADAATPSKPFASPLKGAPAMRDVYGRFNPRELQAELSEGKVSKHKEMPQIAFSDEDVYAILTYLYALAARK